MALLTRKLAVLGAVLALPLAGCAWNWTDRAPGTTDGGEDSGAPSSCADHPGALFCDDFESGDLSAWNGAKAGNTVDVVSMAHGGKYAGRGETAANGAQARIEATWDTPVTSGSIYARAYYFIPTGTVTKQVTILSLHGTDGRIAVVASTQDSIAGTTYISSDLTDGGGGDYSTPEHLNLGKWECLELEIKVGAAPDGAVTIRKNGTAFTNGNRTGVNTAVTGGFRAIRVPIQYSAQDEAFDVYIDDVVVDTAPIGCD